MSERTSLYPAPIKRDPREVLIAAVNGNPVTPDEAWALLHEYDRLRGYSDELAEILLNTARELGMVDPADTLPCGHPLTAVVSADEGTAYCGECAASVPAEKETSE